MLSNQLILIISLINTIYCAPFNHDSENNIPNQRIIDIDNLNQLDIADFNNLNVNLAQLRERQQKLKNKYHHSPPLIEPLSSDQVLRNLAVPSAITRNEENADPQQIEKELLSEPLSSDQAIKNFPAVPSAITKNDEDAERRREFEEATRQTIRKIIESNILRNNSNNHLPHLSSGDINHYTAAHPMCDLPKYMNSTAFFEQNNIWNLFFAPPVSDNVHSAILRLFKKEDTEYDHADKKKVDCSQSQDLIRVTVSYYIRRKEQRKRMCSSVMIARSLTGWIEFDVINAVKFWNREGTAKKNYGIAIEVQDQDKNVLKASDYFNGYTCEASKSTASLPWTIYKENSIFIDNTMPRHPRLDFEIRTSPIHHRITVPNGNHLYARNFNYDYQADAQHSTTSYEEQNVNSNTNSDLEEKPIRLPQYSSFAPLSASSPLSHHHHHRHHHHNHHSLENVDNRQTKTTEVNF